MSKKHKNLLTEENQTRLYLVHHMHHMESGKGKAAHELHHCFLYSQKNKKGEKYRIKHLITGSRLLHILDIPFSGTLYDHLNNPFNIIFLLVKKKKYSVLEA
ncbi:MAG: hypothetical protein Q7T34_01735 [Candidatus Parcubacteria bacterium]|nr:hypothetical protein [Candidatus Parcubacteria bacterium]